MTPHEDPLEAALFRTAEEFLNTAMPGFRITADYTLMIKVIAAMLHRYHDHLMNEIATRILPSMTIPTVDEVAKTIVVQLMKGARDDRTGPG